MRDINFNKDGIDTTVIGNGPAGIGIPLACLAAAEAYETNQTAVLRPEELYGFKLRVLGPKSSLGRGHLAYQVRSNSAAADFIEGIPASVLEALETDPDYQALLQAGENPISLALAANFQQKLARVVLDEVGRLTGTPAHDTYQDAKVSHLQYDDRLDFLFAHSDQGQIVGGGRNVVLALGGEQSALDLPQRPKNLVLSENFLRLDPQDLILLEGKRITVLGGSHSAFSVLHNLRRAGVTSPVTILHRRPVKLFYASPELAQIDGYEFKPESIDGGKINRFDGVRGDAQAAYLAALHGKDPHTTLKLVDQLEDQTAIAEADVVIQATGYTPKQLPIYDFEGREIPGPKPDAHERFSPLTLGQCKVHATGLAQTNRDGVNLFQGKFARKILDQLPDCHVGSLLRGQVLRRSA